MWKRLFGKRKDLCFEYIRIFGVEFRYMRKSCKKHWPEYLNILVNYAKMQKLTSINRYEIESLVENLHHSGVQERQSGPRLIVSLTSYPKRMYDIHLCLYSLLTQSLKPDKVVLWLAEEQFPDKELDVPRKVRELTRWGLEIKWCEDLKSYKKLIPALKEYPDDYIVTADDDIFYQKDWLNTLWSTHERTGAKITAHRCHKVLIKNDRVLPYAKWQKNLSVDSICSPLNFPTGAGGVLYAPRSLHTDILDMETAREVCPNGDDIWFWAMAIRASSYATLSDSPMNAISYINPARELNLLSDGTLAENNLQGGNDVQIQHLLKKYPDILETLLNSIKKN